ncbi:MAG: hypothetical protein A3B66_00430 [Alphaproteobacteria bacterium RIFCSPHIGHO2_02_FULL_46_13]|nr:MAG: hypothetical protein A3B66_00430 [Alphaproteobacteria bacterium RIFCSPHIGHO2_02_FULL_46_13]
MNNKLDHTQIIRQMDREILNARWSELWGMSVPIHLSRPMLEKSLLFKMQEQSGEVLSTIQQGRLENLVKAYQKSPDTIERTASLKPGTRLVRTWRGKSYSVIVQGEGFSYQGKIFSSLSKIASSITGTRWNGWVFFGLKKTASKGEV